MLQDGFLKRKYFKLTHRILITIVFIPVLISCRTTIIRYYTDITGKIDGNLILCKVNGIIERDGFTLLYVTHNRTPFNVVVYSIKSTIKEGDWKYMYLHPLSESYDKEMVEKSKDNYIYISDTRAYYFWIQDYSDLNNLPNSICVVKGFCDACNQDKYFNLVYGIM